MIRKILPYLFGILLLAFLVKAAMGDGDFKVFLEAAKIVNAGQNPYDHWIPISEGHACLYFYSPFWAFVLIPFTSISNFIPNFLWLIFNVWCIYRIFQLLIFYLDRKQLSAQDLNILIGLTVFVSLRFILYNFSLIQVTIFLLWGSLESLRLFRNKKYLIGGLLLALVINIKILPVILLPYLLYRKELKGFLFTSLGLLLYFFIPVPFLGWSHTIDLHVAWWGTVNPSNAEHLLESGLGPHSLTALIPILLSPSTGELNYTRNFVSLDPSTAIFIMNCLRLLLILGTVFVLKWPPFTASKSKPQTLYELAYLFLLVPLIFPHQQKYAFVFIIPAIFYICNNLLLVFKLRKEKDKKQSGILIFLFLLFFILTTLTTDGLIGKQANQWTQHFKLITYGTIVLLVLLIKCKPQNTKPESPVKTTA